MIARHRSSIDRFKKLTSESVSRRGGLTWSQPFPHLAHRSPNPQFRFKAQNSLTQTMPSLTPQHRAEETAEHAFRDGMLSGLLALVPSSAAVYAAMQNKQFVRSTNWQSRTALIISEYQN